MRVHLEEIKKRAQEGAFLRSLGILSGKPVGKTGPGFDVFSKQHYVNYNTVFLKAVY